MLTLSSRKDIASIFIAQLSIPVARMIFSVSCSMFSCRRGETSIGQKWPMGDAGVTGMIDIFFMGQHQQESAILHERVDADLPAVNKALDDHVICVRSGEGVIICLAHTGGDRLFWLYLCCRICRRS